MRDFTCPNCGQRLSFENSVCLSCDSRLGFALDQMAFLVIAEDELAEQAGSVADTEYHLCANLHLAECNWLVPRCPGASVVPVVRIDPDSSPTTPTPRRWPRSRWPRRRSAG